MAGVAVCVGNGRTTGGNMAMEDVERDGGIGVERIQAFSDGVFAIAITLLVLDLDVPRVKHGLLSALGDEWPAYLSYVMSFVVIGIMWAQHHHLFSLVRRTDHLFLLINVFFLMWLAFVPFPTGVLAEHLDNAATARTAMAFYAGTFVVGTLPWGLLWHYASHNGRLLAANAPTAERGVKTWAFNVGAPLYLLDFGLAFVSVPASLILFFLIAALYAVEPLLGARRRS